MENEYGDIGIDENIVVKQESKEQIVEVLNGCLCCTVRGDLVGVMNRLWERLSESAFDAVIIETTGLANPAPVAQTFFINEDVAEKFRLDGIVTVVDAKHVRMHLHDKSQEKDATNVAAEQIAFADRIILNKTDLVTDESELRAIEKEIRTINASVDIYRTRNSVIEPKLLVNIECFELDRILKFDPLFLEDDGGHHDHDHHDHDHHHHHGHHKDEHVESTTSTTHTKHESSIGSVSVSFEGELNINMLQHWIALLVQTMKNDLFRYKGILAVKGMDEKFVFQGVHQIFKGDFGELTWNEGETRTCKFCFIGRNLDGKLLTDGFMKCKVGAPLRFKVGDLVEANVGEWVKAKILRVWEHGNPYRIEIDDETKTNVWGPVDDDSFVRALAN